MRLSQPGGDRRSSLASEPTKDARTEKGPIGPSLEIAISNALKVIVQADPDHPSIVELNEVPRIV